jgi:rare lipoprotein A
VAGTSKIADAAPAAISGRMPEPVKGAAPIKTASLTTLSSSSDDSLPESLRTPTITVEELQGSKYIPAPVQTAKAVASAPVPTHMDKGRVMPDPVVTTEAVKPTGLFVQAGSFAVKENANKLVQKISTFSKARMDEVDVNGRTFYRVKVGPLKSIDEADRVLSRVINLGAGGAKVIKN